jgi:rare lipoprotein A
MRVESKVARWAVFLMAGASLAACASVSPPGARYPTHNAQLSTPPAKGPTSYKTGEPYQVGGIWYVPHEQPDYDQTGIASWYGEAFHLKATADGEVFDMNAVSGAHTTLPLPSLVEVTNLENGRKLTVRVNDRGPFIGGRIIDLSYAAAQQLGYAEKGLAKVRVRYVGPAPLAGPDAGVRVADSRPTKPPAPRADTNVRLADAALPTPAWGFHKPLATRLPAGAAAAAAAPVASMAAAPVAAARAGAAVAPRVQPDDDVILTSYKAPEPVGMSALSSLPAAKAPTAAPVASAPSAPPMPPMSPAPSKGAKPHAPLTGAELGTPHSERIALPEFRPSSPSPSMQVQVQAQAQAQGYRIQAGAFSSSDNARRAAAQLASAGQATVEPFERDGTTLYRVFVPGADDEVAAYAIRDKVAAAGFADARVVPGRPVS